MCYEPFSLKLAAVMAVAIAVPTAAQTLEFNDGGTHTLPDGLSDTSVRVAGATMLTVQTGIGWSDPSLHEPFRVLDNSRLVLNSENADQGIFGFDTALIMTDSRGEFLRGRITSFGSSDVPLTGNGIGAVIGGQSTALIDGARIAAEADTTIGLRLEDTASVVMTQGNLVGDGGGAFDPAGTGLQINSPDASFDLQGGAITGTVTGVQTTGTFQMSGGAIRVISRLSPIGIDATDGHVSVAGGTIASESFDPSSATAVRLAGDASGEFTGTRLSALGPNSFGDGSGTGLHVRDSATAVFRDGEIHAAGGTAVAISVGGLANVTVGDGAFMADVPNDFDFGTAAGLVASGNAVVSVLGGTFAANADNGTVSALSVGGDADVSIFGGNFSVTGVGDEFLDMQDLRAGGNAQVTLFGSDFNYPLGLPIADETGTITGILSDGSAISLTFRRDASATITLVPEPTSVCIPTLLSFGFVSAVFRGSAVRVC